MSIIDGFYAKDCDKIDAQKVNAYFELSLSEENPTELILDNSWEATSVDLASAIKAGETKTQLKLSPADNPTYLEYDGEDGIPQCINGEDLARIIPMTKLKDVDQTTTISDGDVYIYDETINAFKPFDLKTFVTNVNSILNELQGRVTNMSSAITNIQALVNKPSGIPDDAVIVWGNRNIYADYTNTNKKDHGVFTHDTSTNLADDQYFA